MLTNYESSLAVIKKINIGNIEIENPVFLAPMAGITDDPYREIVNFFGANIMYSEMVSSYALIRQSPKALKMSTVKPISTVTAVQLAGSDIPTLVEACKISADNGAQLIDINMGCPVKKVVKGIAGSALMKEEILAGNIMAALVKAVSIPVTVKMRLGWDTACLNSPKLAYIAQESGIALVTVHGRTRQQFFSGEANWEAIAEVKKAVKIPVIANGDIYDEESAQAALKISQADGIMVGRGTYGRPWLIQQITHYLKFKTKLETPGLNQRLKVALAHFNLLIDHYGEGSGLRIARKHLGWYTKGLDNSAAVRARLNVSDDIVEIRDLIIQCFNVQLDNDQLDKSQDNKVLA
ncbi:tRNA-dihydrouridine synthase [Candidatus Hepatincolaceae symbiont of Richtersius coronifer]